MLLLRFGLSVGTAYGTALAVYPGLSLARTARAVVLAAAACLIAATPLFLPPEARGARLLAAVNAVSLLVKLFDLHVGAARGYRPGFREYVAYLPNIFSLVLRRLAGEPRPSRRDDARRLAFGLCGAAAGLALLTAAFAADWSGRTFWTEHAAKVPALAAFLFPLAAAGGAAWRLCGGRARDFVDAPWRARTPAELWRRYNRPVNQFFAENVFRAAGGARSPVWATLATFAASGLIHEYVFAAALGRVQGYQTAFFLLQGSAVAATLRFRPVGLAAVAAGAGTVAFHLLSLVLFLASVAAVVPFYQNPNPLPGASP